MIRKLELTVEEPGQRLDRYLAQRCDLSRSQIHRLIGEGQVRVNGSPAKASLKLNAGDGILVFIPPPSPFFKLPATPSPTTIVPEDIPLKIVYEDDDLLVVDKPAGLPVHPAAGHPSGTLVNALLSHCPDLGGIAGSLRPGIVHRLDKDTSGLMVVAKNDATQASLSRQFKSRSVKKGYLALVTGHLSPRQGAIEAPIGRHTRDRKRMAVVTGGREARTQYQVIRYVGSYTLLEVLPETGRTHQIRVHFSSIGHSLFGDSLYGKRSPLLGRQFLHAHLLGFRLPPSDEYVEFKSELPPELEKTMEQLASASPE